MAREQRKLFSNILNSCRKLQEPTTELAANRVRQDSPFGSSSSRRSSALQTPPPTDVNLGLPSGANNRARRPSTPPSEYRSVTPFTEISRISYEHISPPPQTPQRQSQPISPPPQTPQRQSQPISPAPAYSPLCKKCPYRTVHKVTKTSNRNGNGGRPYFKCENCGAFHSFADSQGINQQNPHCQCDQPSRLGQASIQKGGLPFFVCATGACDFYIEPSSPQSQAPASPIPEMQGMSLRSKRYSWFIAKFSVSYSCDSFPDFVRLFFLRWSSFYPQWFSNGCM